MKRASVFFRLLVKCSIVITCASVPIHGAAAEQACDCSQIVTSCLASFRLDNIKNDPKQLSSSADLILSSSHPRCSKIEFYVDNTPHLSVLKNGSQTEERIFGTGKITTQTVKIESCRVCASADDGTRPKETPAASTAASQMFSDALANDSFDSSEAERRLEGYRAQAQQSDQFHQNMMGVMTGVMGIVQQRQAIQSTPNTGDIWVPKVDMLPAHCRGNPAAAGCPYAPANLDPRPLPGR